MKNIHKILFALLLGFSLVGFSACPEVNDEPETVGEQVDESLEETGDAIEDAADEAEDDLEQ